MVLSCFSEEGPELKKVLWGLWSGVVYAVVIMCQPSSNRMTAAKCVQLLEHTILTNPDNHVHVRFVQEKEQAAWKHTFVRALTENVFLATRSNSTRKRWRVTVDAQEADAGIDFLHPSCEQQAIKQMVSLRPPTHPASHLPALSSCHCR